MKKELFNGVGRRKESTARVYLSDGSGTSTVNKKLNIDSHLKRESLVIHAMKPLEVLNLKDKYDLNINVSGGGLNWSSWSNSTWYSKSSFKGRCRI